jgi:hypothetical protein
MGQMRGVSLVFLCLSALAHAQTCPPGQALCGQMHCTPTGDICCADSGYEEVSCPGGTQCTGDGGCAPGGTCVSGWRLTQASCGADSCSCSAPCANGADCESGCCSTAGFCAPSCVCTANGRLYVDCDRTTGGATGIAAPKGGCDISGGSAGLVPLAIAALLLLTWRARRRAA